MRSPLHSRIAALRARVRRLLALHGLGRVIAGTAAFIVLACLADWSVHLSRELRLGLLAGLIGLAAYLLVRFVVLPLVVRFRDLDIALKIENRWPGLNDRLASTIQFLDLPREGNRADILGSQALRDATVAQTMAEVESIDFRAVVDPRPARNASLVALGSLLVGLAVYAADPRLARIALDRLFRPLSATAWPQMTHLAILNAPAKVAKGEPFALDVGVGKDERAPRSAKVTYRYSDGEVATESLRPDNKNQFHGRKESVEKSFTFRVAAGDDATRERSVQVVPPPVVTSFDVRLSFPAYTGLPEQRLASGKTSFQAVRGTRVSVLGAANKPLSTARLVRGEGQSPLDATLSPSKTNFQVEFVLDDSALATFALRDTEGFASQERDAVRLDFRADKDEAPKVSIEEPANDRDVTPNADVPIEVVVDDDYGLGSIRLVYATSAQGSEATREVVIPLWAAPESKDKARPLAPTKHQTVAYILKLEPLKLTPGSLVAFHADARDLDTLRGPNVGKSREIHLRVVTPEQMNAQLEEQRRAIREEIDRALGMQKQALAPVRDALRTLSNVDDLDPARREEVKNAETIQRQLTGRITNPADGLEPKIRKQIADLENLKIDNPDARKQMDDLLDGVQSIKDNHLGPAEQGLTRASKELDEKAEARGLNGEPKAGADKKNAAQGKASQATKSADQAKVGQAKTGQQKPGDRAKPGDDEKRGDQAGSSEASKAEDRAKTSDSAKADDAKTDSSKAVQQSPPSPSGKPSPAKDALTQAEKDQKAIADELQRMRDSLGEFETYKGVVNDAKKLLKDHEEAMKAANEAANKVKAATKAEDLTPQQQNDLAGAADRQDEAARDLAKLENKMDEMAGRLEQSDPSSSAALKDAAQQSRQKGTSGKMDEASKGIKQNQMGDAQAKQKQAQQDLKKLVDALQNRRENELARLVKDLKAAEQAMKDLRAQQAKNQEQTKKAGQMADGQQKKEELQKLSKDQKKIQEQLKKQLLSLQKLRADAAAAAGSKAQGKMAQAGQEQEEGDAEDAEKQQDEALAGLDEAQEEIEEARKDAEEQLAMEQLSKIKDNLQGLADRQDQVNEETTAYDLARSAKPLTQPQRVGVRALGRVQEALKDEAEELTERLDAAPAFALNLKRAGAKMDEAAKKLQDLNTDEETRKAEGSASKRIKQLLEALKPDPPQGGAAGGGGGGGSGQGGQQRRGDGIGMVAQLKILKMLQQEVNDRTEAIDEIKARRKTLTTDQQVELDGLADDQRTIADLARDLTKPKKSDGED